MQIHYSLIISLLTNVIRRELYDSANTVEQKSKHRYLFQELNNCIYSNIMELKASYMSDQKCFINKPGIVHGNAHIWHGKWEDQMCNRKLF